MTAQLEDLIILTTYLTFILHTFQLLAEIKLHAKTNRTSDQCQYNKILSKTKIEFINCLNLSLNPRSQECI